MTREEWINIYNVKDGTWDKDDLIDKAYEIITSPIKTNYDRIKSMSVEEMAKLFDNIQEMTFKNIRYWKQWLLQEVSEDE